MLDAANRDLTQHPQFAFSAITRYEMTRGFRATKAVRGLTKFLKLVDDSDVLSVSIPELRRTADLWADADRGGDPRGDADVIIAATALESKRVLATGNTAHFTWIPGLTVTDWRSGSPQFAAKRSDKSSEFVGEAPTNWSCAGHRQLADPLAACLAAICGSEGMRVGLCAGTDVDGRRSRWIA